jgi:hypothetical protein
MYTTVALLALSGLLAPATAVRTPSWLTDYASAQEQGRCEQKPLAVFLASGHTGWEQLSQEGRLGEEISHLLAANYVCVYVDTSEASGKRLASAFDMPDGLGLVISNRSGELQAFRHEGDLANDDLAGYLRRYADPTRVVRSTETNPPHVSQHLTPPPAPAALAPGYFRPGGFAPFFGGGRSC